MSSFSVRKHSYSSVPDTLLEKKDLSIDARFTLAWMLGRPAGWEIRVKFMVDKLGLTDRVWRKIRKEIIEAGYFTQTKIKTTSGKFIWYQEVTDDPLYAEEPKKSNIENHPTFCTHGKRKDAKGTNKTIELKQSNSITHHPNPSSPEQSENQKKEIEVWPLVEIDFSNLRCLTNIIKSHSSLVSKLESQMQADALEQSFRVAEASGNKIRIPSKVLDFLKTKTLDQLSEWGEAIRSEREKNKVIKASSKISTLFVSDPNLEKIGREIIAKGRKLRANLKAQSP